MSTLQEPADLALLQSRVNIRNIYDFYGDNGNRWTQNTLRWVRREWKEKLEIKLRCAKFISDRAKGPERSNLMITKEMLKVMPITQAMLEANKVATLDEADEYISKLINIPVDREEAKEVFERIFNYDPVSYYDKKDIAEIVDSKLEDAKYSHLEDDRDDIIDESYEIFDGNRHIHLDSAVKTALDLRMGADDDDDINDIRKQLSDDFDDEDFDYDDLDEED